MSINQKVTRTAGLVGTATLLSRIFGYVRDVSIAVVFGAGPISDAFIAAFRIPNMIRRLFGEGSLSVSVVPVVSEYLHTHGRHAAVQIAVSGIRLLSFVLAIIAAIGVLTSPWLASVVAYGFKATPDKFDLTVSLTRMMFPYVSLIGILAFLMGILNAMGHFAAPALAPVMLNAAMIGSLWLATMLSDNPVVRVNGLAAGVLLGGVLQVALQIPFLIRSGVRLWGQAPWLHPGLRDIAKLFVPATFGAAVLQINTVVINLLASFQFDGSVTFLYFADRLVQLPLGIFGIAIATAVLPVFSRQTAIGDIDAFKDTLAYGIKLVLFLTLPSMVGLAILRVPIVALLFEHGAFDSAATRLTAHALLYYTVGLWAFAAIRIVVATFYALQDTVTPVRIAMFSIIANIGLGWILMQAMSHAGLALALSLSSILNLALLTAALQRRIGTLDWKSMGGSAAKTVCGSLLMGIIVWITSWFINACQEPDGGTAPWELTVSIAVGILSYGMFAYWIKCPELQSVRLILQGRKPNP